MTDTMETRLVERLGALDAAIHEAESRLTGRVTDSFRRLSEHLDRASDDLAVVAALVQRLDSTIAGLTTEIRATHTQYFRFDRRLRKLEGED